MPARHRTSLAGIVVVGAALRFATLDVQSYWFDEAVTVQLLRMDLGDMLSAIPDSESTPPLYYVAAWLWTQLFGTGEVGLRSLSALAGTATIPVAYGIAARTANVRVGLLAAALVAANPILVWYSQEARSYALLVLLTALTVLVLTRVGERPSAARLAGWAALAAAAVATHYFAVFVVVPEAAWLVWRLRRRALAPIAGVGIVALALLPMAIEQAENDGASFIRSQSALVRAVALPKQALIGYDAPGEVVALLVAAALALVALYLLARRTSPAERRAAIPLAALVAIAVLVPAVVSFAGADYLITRNVIAAIVPALVVLAIGYGASRAGRLGVAAGAALALVGAAMTIVVAVEDSAQRTDWRALAERLGQPSERRLLVVSPPVGRVPLDVYLPNVRRVRPNEQAPVQEIVVVAVASRGFASEDPPPRATQPTPLPGFGVADRVETDTYTLVVYRAAEPKAFPDPPLYGLALERVAAALMLQVRPPAR